MSDKNNTVEEETHIAIQKYKKKLSETDPEDEEEIERLTACITGNENCMKDLISMKPSKFKDENVEDYKESRRKKFGKDCNDKSKKQKKYREVCDD